MIKYESKMDQTGKIYIPKAIRQAGIKDIVTIAPGSSACVIFTKGTPLEHVLESIRIIIMDLEFQLKKDTKV